MLFSSTCTTQEEDEPISLGPDQVVPTMAVIMTTVTITIEGPTMLDYNQNDPCFAAYDELAVRAGAARVFPEQQI